MCMENIAHRPKSKEVAIQLKCDCTITSLLSLLK